MQNLITLLQSPWPWYVSGPLIGLMVPLLIIVGNRSFGISQNLEHLCAITQPRHIQVKFFQYDWRISTWSLVFMGGVTIGGFLASVVFADPNPVQLSEATLLMLAERGLASPTGFNPPELFSFSIQNVSVLLGGGILIGFGTRYASGCTSGHAITGLATFQIKSLYAVLGIFSGGAFSAYFIAPTLGY